MVGPTLQDKGVDIVTVKPDIAVHSKAGWVQLGDQNTLELLKLVEPVPGAEQLQIIDRQKAEPGVAARMALLQRSLQSSFPYIRNKASVGRGEQVLLG